MMTISATAVFPATFDPITNGHVAIAERTARLFERLVVGVYAHDGPAAKQPLFSLDERVALVRAALAHIPNARVRHFDGLAIDFARAEGAQSLVRGLRVADDFELERQMAMMNRHLAPEIETLLLISDPAHAFVSASIVREVALMGGDVSRLVPPVVAEALASKARRPVAAPLEALVVAPIEVPVAEVPVAGVPVAGVPVAGVPVAAKRVAPTEDGHFGKERVP